MQIERYGGRKMVETYSRAYAAVDLDAIHFNIERMQEQLSPGTGLFAVIKTDGYGHGAVPVARELEPLDVIKGFAVATAEEALILRSCGIKKNILILGHVFPESYEALLKEGITLSLFRYDMAQALSGLAAKLGGGIQAKVHIKLDTGMSRIGLIADQEGLETVKRICALPGLDVSGIFTHFARADERDKTEAHRQLTLFQNFVRQAEEETGHHFALRHCSNSAGILDLREADLDVVRAGISLYGLRPSEEVSAEPELRAALELKSRIILLKEVEAGTPVSYGGTFVTGRRTRIATIPLGYGDGYPRGLSNKGSVLIRGQRAPVIGRVCMDQFMADVTDISQVQEGDTVTLIGRDGDEEITMEELGRISGRFHYELACCLGKRIPRLYRKNGQIVAAKDYFHDFL